jgi:F-type H+/Na+-transporting ATPase subunit alpha
MTQTLLETHDDAWLARSRETVARIDLAPQAETVGRVERVGDGIALVSGLPDACLNELLRFDSGRMGFALTLDADSIGAVLLDESEAIEAGSRVTGTGEVVRVPVGAGLLGRIVDPLGRPRPGRAGEGRSRNAGRTPGAGDYRTRSRVRTDGYGHSGC